MAATFRAAVSEDTPSVADLAAQNGLLTDGLDRDGFTQLLRWLHETPRPGPRLQVVGEANGEIVAHYGAMPIKVAFRGREVMMGLASNLVIAERARRTVSFFSLQNYFHKQYQANSYDLLCGCITRKGVLEPHLRAGWKKLGSLPVSVRPVSLGAICSKTLSNRIIANALHPFCVVAQACFNLVFRVSGRRRIRVEELKQFAPEHDAFLSRWQESQEIASYRDSATLNWRFFGFSERNYKVFVADKEGAFAGYVAVRSMRMKNYLALALVDVVVTDGDKEVLQALLARVVDTADILRADLVATVIQPSSWVARYLRWKGFLRTPEQFTFVTHQPKTSLIAFSADLFPRWFLTWFEHDFV